MTTEDAPRVEVKIKASRICFLSRPTNFYNFHVSFHFNLHNSQEEVIFLKSGFADVEGVAPFISDQNIQCFDTDSGEQVHVFDARSQAEFTHLGSGYTGVRFTTSSKRTSGELAFDPSALRPGRKYSIRFKKTSSITCWPVSVWKSSQTPSSLKALPSPSKRKIPHVFLGTNDVVFEVRDAPPVKPKITVALSADSTFSRSGRQPFKYTLTFSSDAPGPITVLAERPRAHELEEDIEIIDPTSGTVVAPDKIDIEHDDEPEREDFLTIEATYTEHREIDVLGKGWKWEDMKTLEIGKEYILRSVGGHWSYCTDDSIDDIMTYLQSSSHFGLTGQYDFIEFEGGGEQRFKVVE